MIRIVAAQINPTVGDFRGNVALIGQDINVAAADGADLVVFPELALTGYYPGDLLQDPGFIDGARQALTGVLDQSARHPDLWVVLGTITTRTGPGKPLQNSALVIRNGTIRVAYGKQLLPTYDVFDERRHFEPGAPDQRATVRINDHTVGFMVCEDGWGNDSGDYAENPYQTLIRQGGVDLIVAINASPSNVGKRAQRHAVFGAAARAHGTPILYVNMVGGQDSLVFDGASFAVGRDGVLAAEAPMFRSARMTVDFDGTGFAAGWPCATLQPDLAPEEFARRQIVLGLRDYLRRCGFDKVVVGSSGGIDSALTLALAVEALGPDNVTAITIPSAYSSPGSVDDSVTLAANLGIILHSLPIGAMVDCAQRGAATALGAPFSGIALENLQARIRGTLLMGYSNQSGALLLTTGNKSELSVGYCTLYGDTNGGLGLIGDLYKTEVFAVARHINASLGGEVIPRAILDKEPSAELAPDQRDSDSLPPYEVLDDVLKHLLEGDRLPLREREAVAVRIAALQATGDGRALLGRIRALIARNEYKRRQAPPVVRVRARAFGAGRQMPVAAVHIQDGEAA